MVESEHNAPHAWSMVQIDVTNVWKWRAREKDRFERETGYKLTLLPFFIRAVVEAMSAFPLMNARFNDGAASKFRQDINIGIAIGLPTNLVVPVVRNADRLSITRPGGRRRRADRSARRSKLGRWTICPAARSPSTTTARTARGRRHRSSTPDKPASSRWKRSSSSWSCVADDSFAIRSMMNSCLSLDHRVVDGYVASGFLAELKRRLEAMGPEGTL